MGNQAAGGGGAHFPENPIPIYKGIYALSYGGALIL